MRTRRNRHGPGQVALSPQPKHADHFRGYGDLPGKWRSTAKHNRILLGLNLGEQIYCMTSGVPPTVSTRWAATQITPKFEELNRRAAIEDHRHCNAFGRRIRGSENFLSFNRGLKVVYFKRYVRD